jgi:hypothetical protein
VSPGDMLHRLAATPHFFYKKIGFVPNLSSIHFDLLEKTYSLRWSISSRSALEWRISSCFTQPMNHLYHENET